MMLEFLIEVPALSIPQSPVAVMGACENLDSTLSLPYSYRRYRGEIWPIVVSVIIVVIVVVVVFIVVGHDGRSVDHGMHFYNMSKVTVVIVLTIACRRPCLAWS